MHRKTSASSPAPSFMEHSSLPFRSDVAVLAIGVVALAGIGVLYLRGGQLSLDSTGLSLEVLAPT